jgi:hypothetical protein
LRDDAELVAVIAADPREVVDGLQDALGEGESRVVRPADGTAETAVPLIVTAGPIPESSFGERLWLRSASARAEGRPAAPAARWPPQAPAGS